MPRQRGHRTLLHPVRQAPSEAAPATWRASTAQVAVGAGRAAAAALPAQPRRRFGDRDRETIAEVVQDHLKGL